MRATAARHIGEVKIDGYRLMEVLGEGASGLVYRAHATGDITQNFAIKISKTDWDTDSVESRIRLENEAELYRVSRILRSSNCSRSDWRKAISIS